MNLILIALGGALGSVARFLSVSTTGRILGLGFPFGTLFVNVLGSFLMGIAAAVLVERLGTSSKFAPFVMTGFLGGFTTFSAFSLDSYYLFESGRMAAMIVYAVLSVLLSLIALIAGMTLARMVTS